MQLHEALHERQPETQAAARAIEALRLLHEEIEDAREQVGADALAGVAHAQHRPSAPPAPC